MCAVLCTNLLTWTPERYLNCLITFMYFSAKCILCVCLSTNIGNAGVTAIFEGQREHLVPNLSATVLECDLFAMAGRMIGHSAIHGGPSLSGLSLTIIDALIHGTKDIVTSKLCLEDCPEIEVRDTISLVSNILTIIFKKYTVDGHFTFYVCHNCCYHNLGYPQKLFCALI